MTRIFLFFLFCYCSLSYALPDASKNVYEKPELNIAKRLEREPIKVIFEPQETAVISAEMEGRIIDLPYRLGDSIKKDETIVQLDPRKAESAYQQAAAQLEKLEQILVAVEELYQFGDESEINLSNAQSDVRIKEAEVDYAFLSLESMSLKAPFDGKVAGVFVNEFENVERGKPLLKVFKSGAVKGIALFPSYLFAKVSVGEEVIIEVAATKMKTTGKILHVAPFIDPSSSTVKVELSVENPDIIPGMIGYIPIEFHR